MADLLTSNEEEEQSDRLKVLSTLPDGEVRSVFVKVTPPELYTSNSWYNFQRPVLSVSSGVLRWIEHDSGTGTGGDVIPDVDPGIDTKGIITGLMGQVTVDGAVKTYFFTTEPYSDPNLPGDIIGPLVILPVEMGLDARDGIMFSPNLDNLNGASIEAPIRIDNTNGELNDWQANPEKVVLSNFEWTLKRGRFDDPWSQWHTVLNSVGYGYPIFENNHVLIYLSSKHNYMKAPISEAFTSSDSVYPHLFNKNKPLVFGKVNSVEPLRINTNPKEYYLADNLHIIANVSDGANPSLDSNQTSKGFTTTEKPNRPIRSDISGSMSRFDDLQKYIHTLYGKNPNTVCDVESFERVRNQGGNPVLGTYIDNSMTGEQVAVLLAHSLGAGAYDSLDGFWHTYQMRTPERPRPTYVSSGFDGGEFGGEVFIDSWEPTPVLEVTGIFGPGKAELDPANDISIRVHSNRNVHPLEIDEVSDETSTWSEEQRQLALYDWRITEVADWSQNRFSDIAPNQPVVKLSSITPNTGGELGGTNGTLYGENFNVFGSLTLTFDGVPASVSVFDSSQLTYTAPPGVQGFVDVKIEQDGFSDTLVHAFEYTSEILRLLEVIPESARETNSVSLVVEHADINSPATVLFDTTPASNVVVVSSTQITCDVPAGDGVVDVTVSQNGDSFILANAFEYKETITLKLDNNTFEGNAITTELDVSVIDGGPISNG